MLNEIIAIYAITDDLLKGIGHDEDGRILVSDAEIITTAVCAAMFFNGNHSKACTYMQEHGLIRNMLDKSRFNRRLHGIFMLMNDLFHQMGMILKEISDDTEYLLDSFPVAMCDNMITFLCNGRSNSVSGVRLCRQNPSKCKIYAGEAFRRWLLFVIY